MTRKSDTSLRAAGLALIVLGAGLGWWGYEMSGSLGAQLSQGLTGALPDAVMHRYIGGAVCAAVGLVLTLR